MLHRQVPTSSVETGHPVIPNVIDVLHFDFKPFNRLDPVPSSESAIFDVLTRKPVLFNVLGSDGRKPETVYPHELYPITQPIRLTHAIPGEVWGDEIEFDETMKYWGNLFSGYKRMETKGTYMKAILMDNPDTQWRINGSLDLFGVTNNSLSHVLALARYVTNRKLSSSIILHFITMVCMQYYLMERNRFLVVYTNEQDVHRSSMHPYLFLLFPRYDVKRNPFVAAYHSVLDSCTWASRYDLTSFIYSVCKCLVARIRMIGNHLLSDSDIDLWCKNTLFSNLKLFLVTSRFMHVPVIDYAKEIRDSIVNHTDMPDQYDRNPLVTDSDPVKSFVAPSRMYLTPVRFSNDAPPYNNIGDMPDQMVRVVHNSLLPLQSKIPVPYCHFFFNPIRPVSIFNDDDLYTILYELSKYFDKSLSDKTEKELSRSMLPGSKTTHYPHEKINMVRVAYSYILKDNQLWTGVGAYLHVPPDIRFHSHASPVDIDEPTWDWIYRRAQSHKIEINAKQQQIRPSGSFSDFCFQHVVHGPDSHCNAFIVLHAVISTHGSTEEDAIGYMIRQKMLSSNRQECLSKLRAGYGEYLAGVISQSHDLFGETGEGFANLKALISRARVSWCKTGHRDIPIPSQSEWEDALRPKAPFAVLDRVLDVVRGSWIWRFPVLVAKPVINERSVELFRMQRELPFNVNLLYQLMKDMRAKSFAEEVEKHSKRQNDEQTPLSRLLFESLSYLSDGLNRWMGSDSLDDDKTCSSLRSLCRDRKQSLLINVNKDDCKAKCVRMLKTWITLRPRDADGSINKIVFDEMVSCFSSEEIPVILADILTNELNGNELIAFKHYIDQCKQLYETKHVQSSDRDVHLKTLIGKELCRVGMKRKRDD